jgi:hypothetical protein
MVFKRKSAKVEKIDQILDEDFLGDIKQYPSQVRRWFSSNILQRAIVYLFGWTEDNKPIRIRVTNDGKLKTIAYSRVYEDYETFEGSADAITGATITFTDYVSKIEFWISGADAKVQFLKFDKTWGSLVSIPQGYWSVEFSTNSVKIFSKDANVNVEYVIIGWR